MKLLVTGASGLLGSKLCELAINRKHDVYSAYSRHRPRIGKIIQLDVSNGNDVETKFGQIEPEAVVHAAALTDVDRCELERELAWKINVEGTRKIAELCSTHHVFLVYVSTDYVFDGEKGMYKETDKPAPVNYYGFTKLKGEESVKNFENQFCTVRSSVIYGSIPATGKMNFALWLLERLGNKEKVAITTNQWNSPTLNINLANMILEVLERKLSGVFHLAGATRISRYEFARSVAETFDLDTNLITAVFSNDIPWLAKRPKDSSLDVDKTCQTLKNKPLQILEALDKMKRDMK